MRYVARRAPDTSGALQTEIDSRQHCCWFPVFYWECSCLNMNGLRAYIDSEDNFNIDLYYLLLSGALET